MDIMAENDKIATVQETLDLINNVKDGLNLPPKKQQLYKMFLI